MTSHYVVTPVRNAECTIDATIWSVVSQMGGLDIHYHVQDGASTDSTLSRIEAWAARIERKADNLPSRIRFTFASSPDRGMYDAIANGFSTMAIPQDALMNWCNADDALWPNALESVTRLARDLPDEDWFLGWPSWFDDAGRFTAIERMPRYPQAILAAGLADGIHWPFVQQESSFWRKRLWDKAGGLDASLRLAGDWDLWVRFSRLKPLVHAHRQLGAFHVRPGQQSADMEGYRAEMETRVATAIRQPGLRAQIQRGIPLCSVPWAIEDSSGQWRLSARSCSHYAGILSRAMWRFPLSTPALTRFIHRIW